MTNAQIFKLAHQIARQTVAQVGCYAIAFQMALKGAYQAARAIAGGNNIWAKNGQIRVYINHCRAWTVLREYGIKYREARCGAVYDCEVNGREMDADACAKLIYKLEGSYFDLRTGELMQGHQVVSKDFNREVMQAIAA